jgi:hypothetical protein
MIRAGKIHKKTIPVKTPIENEADALSVRSCSEKGFKYCWDVVEIPVYVLIAATIAAVLIQAYGGEVLNRYLKWLSWVVSIAVFSYIGYSVAEKRKLAVRVAAKAGAYAGAISGFFSAIIGILSYYMYPEIYAKSIEMAVSQGANPEMIASITQIALYAMLILSPLITALIGMVLAAIVAWFVIKKY